MTHAALISGGVDSSVSVHILKEQGITPDLYYIKIGMPDDAFMHCSAEEDIEMSQAVARKYGCKLHVVDLQEEYWERVVSYLIERVRQGLTPNPDVMCNKLIKFGCFEENWGHAYDRIVTGHYAWRIEQNNKVYLGTAIDPVKDQTDFLSQLSYNQVKKLLFPLGRMMKGEVRQIAENNHLVSAHRKDSQGICFLGKTNYNDLIRSYLGEKEGRIVELKSGRVLGNHRGYWFHTLGQRKGLGLSQGPWYVADKDIEENTVYVTHADDIALLCGNTFEVHNLNVITDTSEIREAMRIKFKIRHSPEFLSGRLHKISENNYTICSDEMIQGIAPGQFGVIYNESAEICLGSGEISLKE